MYYYEKELIEKFDLSNVPFPVAHSWFYLAIKQGLMKKEYGCFTNQTYYSFSLFKKRKLIQFFQERYKKYLNRD